VLIILKRLAVGATLRRAVAVLPPRLPHRHECGLPSSAADGNSATMGEPRQRAAAEIVRFRSDGIPSIVFGPIG